MESTVRDVVAKLFPSEKEIEQGYLPRSLLLLGRPGVGKVLLMNLDSTSILQGFSDRRRY